MQGRVMVLHVMIAVVSCTAVANVSRDIFIIPQSQEGCTIGVASGLVTQANLRIGEQLLHSEGHAA